MGTKEQQAAWARVTGQGDYCYRYVATKHGLAKKVDICETTVVAHLSRNASAVTEIMKLQDSASRANLSMALNPILHAGQEFIVYPRCSPLNSSNIPLDTYRQDLQRIEGLAQFGFWDFRGTHDGNVWLCDGHLKVIDQDPPWNHIPHGRKEFAALAKGQFIRLSGFVEGLV